MFVEDGASSLLFRLWKVSMLAFIVVILFVSFHFVAFTSDMHNGLCVTTLRFLNSQNK